MQEPSIVTDYIHRLVHELSFDIPLSRRVRAEIEDHFCEAAADDLGGSSIEAQRRAIASAAMPF